MKLCYVDETGTGGKSRVVDDGLKGTEDHARQTPNRPTTPPAFHDHVRHQRGDADGMATSESPSLQPHATALLGFAQ